MQEVLAIPIGLLDDHPDNSIFNFDEEGIKELAASIGECGVLEPLLVQPKEDGRYLIISGHRRKAAAQMAGLKEVPCVLKREGVSDVVALVEANLRMRELTVMSKARAIKMLVEELHVNPGADIEQRFDIQSNNWTLKKLLSMPKSTYYLYYKLNDLIPELQAMVDQGVLGIKLAADIASKYPDHEVQRTLYAVLGDGISDIGPDEVRKLREQNDRGYLVLEVMQRELKRLEAELSRLQKKGEEFDDLERQIARLKAKKKELEYDLLDRESAARALKERNAKNGAALLAVVEKLARPIAGAKPEIEFLIEKPIDAATAANLLKWANAIVEVGQMLVTAAKQAIKNKEE